MSKMVRVIVVDDQEKTEWQYDPHSKESGILRVYDLSKPFSHRYDQPCWTLEVELHSFTNPVEWLSAQVDTLSSWYHKPSELEGYELIHSDLYTRNSDLTFRKVGKHG